MKLEYSKRQSIRYKTRRLLIEKDVYSKILGEIGPNCQSADDFENALKKHCPELLKDYEVGEKNYKSANPNIKNRCLFLIHKKI